ncbi:MAG: ABC transporter transmembrane domain-containing protein [Candidatus Aminicenantes bacterium]|nr:ABC transporter transmembrane domain-containing protein [Candidatus Aminicenantes bacterium]
MKSKILRELLKKYKVALILMLLIAVTVIWIGIAETEIGRRIINLISKPASDGTGGGPRLLTYGLVLLAAALASGAGEYGLTVIYSRFSQAFISDLRVRLFNHLLQLPQDFFNKNPIGQIINRIMNEAGTIGSFFAKMFMQPMIKIFMTIFYGVYLFRLNARLAFVGILFIPLYLIILPKFNRRIQKLTAESINSAGNLTGHFQEVFGGIADVRASQTYFFEESRLKKKIRESVDRNFHMAKTSGGLDALIKTIMRLAPVSLYLYGGSLCLKGDLAPGTLVAAIVVVNILYNQLVAIMNFITEWRQVSVRLDKLDEYFRSESEAGIFAPEEGPAAAVGDIQFDQVQFGFTADQMLLNDINFAAPFGKKVALVGPSGSGKSLTAALLGTIYKPLGGNIAIGGKKAEAIPLYDLRTKIGYVNQNLFLFNDTIKNNILYALLRKPAGEADQIETWVDYSLFDHLGTPAGLEQRLLDTVKDVGLFEDVINMGLRSRPKPEAGAITASDQAKIVKARNELRSEIAGPHREYVEFYRDDRFLEYGSIFENIVFCPTAAITERFGSGRRFCRERLQDGLKAKGLWEKLFQIGLRLARTDHLLLEKLAKEKSPLLDYIEFDPKQIESRRKINARLPLGGDAGARIEPVDPALVEEIIELALTHCPGQSKEQVLDETMRAEILSLRPDVKRCLSEKSKGEIEFFDEAAFNPFLSLLENIVFGNIDPLRKKANEEIQALVRKLVQEAGLESLAVKLGLEFNVGERGAKLSGGQRQKVVIARILLKNPSVLILDEATAALDMASQARINDLVAEKYRDKTVISIAHRLNIIKDYDEILVFDKGRIVEQGTFEDLMKKGGLFNNLYQGSN